MFVRLHKQQKNLLVSDGLLLLSAVFALGLGVTDTMTYKLGGLGDEEIGDADTSIRLAKVLPFFSISVNFAKVNRLI
jgi:hypothetical protein